MRTLSFDHILHLMKQIARDEMGPVELSYWGYVSSYNAQTNCVQVRVPALRSGDLDDFISPWMPLGTPMSGNGYGFQYAPDVGVPCEVTVVARSGGASITTVLLYNDVYATPWNDLATNDFGWMHKVGSYAKYTSDGVVAIVPNTTLNLGTAAPTDFVAKGDTQNDALNSVFTSLSDAATAAAAAMTSIATNLPTSAGPCGTAATAFTALVTELSTIAQALQAALSTIVKVG